MESGLVFEVLGSCLECQHLHRPNPVEDHFVCLRSLVKVVHELDEPQGCGGFEELKALWVPLRTVEGYV